MTPIRVLVIEDDAGVREGLVALLQQDAALRCLGAFGSVEEALEAMPEADVALLDVNLPGLSGIEGARLFKERHPALQVVMLTVYEDSERIFRALQAGASGYLLKRTSPARLLEAIEEVHRGGSPMSSQIARKVVQSFQEDRPDVKALEEAHLTARERQILDLLAQGYLYKEIAAALFITVETVRTHLRRIYEKLHVRSRTEAVVKYLGRS